MYSCVYLIRKVVEKKIFYKKKFMKCIFKYTPLYTNYILDSVKNDLLLVEVKPCESISNQWF